jgi:O-antigen ligase
MLHQVQHYLMDVNLRLLYFVGIPALFGLVMTGGIQRAFRGRPAYYWTAFTVWVAMAVPFSIWKGHSFVIFAEYLRSNFVMLLVIAGLAVTWRQCRMLMYAIASAAVVNLATAKLFQRQADGRVSLEFGTVANSNDFAAHLLLVLPFLLWVGLSTRNIIVRIIALFGIGVGLYWILGTGSRGAFVGLAGALLFFVIRATARQRIALIALAPVGVLALATIVPRSALERIFSYSQDDTEAAEAVQSRRSREYLFRKSLEYTLQHPVFGVGPGEFPEYEGTTNRIPGTTHGYWLQTHNTITQVSSECGIPAALLFIAGIATTFGLLNSTYKQARRDPVWKDIQIAVFCIMLGYVGFCVAAMFLNFAYFFYFPAMAGLAIAVSHAAREEMQTREATPRPTIFMPPPRVPRVPPVAFQPSKPRQSAVPEKPRRVWDGAR